MEVSFPLLTAIIVVPALGALAAALVPTRPGFNVVRLIGVTTSAATGALTIYALINFEVGGPELQFASRHEWVEQWGISWNLGLDGISLFLIVLGGILFPLALLGADPGHDEKSYVVWMLALEAAVMGSFLTLDLFGFFVFFELTLVPMYFLIGGWGYADRVHAAFKFFLYTFAASALMLVSIIATVYLYRNATGELTFDLATLANPDTGIESVVGVGTARWLFLGFAIAFAVKVPVFPVHTWLPDAHTEAPTAGSVILAGLLLKLGTYGFFRFAIDLFPEATRYFAPTLVTLGVIGIIYGAIVATMQRDLKRLVAYSSIAHLGFIILGTFALTPESMSGGVMQMVNHGVSTGALFFLVGMISARRHTREIAKLRGIQVVAPIFAGVFTVVMLSSVGVPGLNGFVGEFLVLIGSFTTRRWWTVVATAGVILAALYLLYAYQRVFHGPIDDENRSFKELTVREGLVLAPLVAIIFFTGIHPKPMLDRINPAVERLVERVNPEANEPIEAPEVAAEAEGEGEGEGEGGTGEGEGEDARGAGESEGAEAEVGG